MKMKIKLLSLAAMAAIVAGCSSDDENMVPVVDETKDTPITIASAGVAELTATRAIMDGALEGAGATLGLYVSHQNAKYKADHELYTYDNIKNEWGFTKTGSKDDTQLLFNGGSFDWIAYSPYSITSGTTTTSTTNLYDATTFSVPTDGNYSGGSEEMTYGKAYTVDGSQYDLLWGKDNSTSHTLTPSLSHALTKITVNITKLGTEIEGTPTVSSVTISGTIPTGTLNLTGATTAAGVVTIPTENAVAAAEITALKLYDANFKTETEQYLASFEALIIPQTATLTLTVTLDDDDRTFTKTLSEQAFVSGTHYSITLQVGKDKVSVAKDGITAAAWNTYDGGELKTE